MSPEEKKAEEGFDLFIANKIYPEAELIFTADLKSLAQIKDEALVVLDTNALLVPYSIGKESLDQIQQTYEGLVSSQRLVIPGQVAREFAKNRASKIGELFQQLNRKRDIPGLQKGKYPLLESLEEYQQVLRLEKTIDKHLKGYKEAIDTVLDRIREWSWDDPVSLLYGELFGENVVFDPQFDEDEIQTELQRRQLHQIPPGYKDSAKDDQGIGDLLIWYTILKLGKSKKQSVIFVSGEQKADWWHRSEGQALYPRYELVDEFRRHSAGQTFHIVQFSRFLDLYGVSASIVQEVREEEMKQSAELALVGEFIRKWKTFEQTLLHLYRQTHPDASERWMPVQRMARALYKKDAISNDLGTLIAELNAFRNQLVHEHIELSAQKIRRQIAVLDDVYKQIWSKCAG
ncbi:MAG: DUF4935 domain-containing protein [Chloroflexi bacterium]|nr:DUF4935 domain-containing protein [Chloroflexota bacterium]